MKPPERVPLHSIAARATIEKPDNLPAAIDGDHMHATHITTGAHRRGPVRAAPRRRPLRLAAAAALALVFVAGTAAPAAAVSIRDLVELSRAGLSDEVLVALIEADETDFALDAPKILELRQAGVSERVITAMLESGRSRRQAEAAAAAEAVPPAASPVQAGAPDPYFVIIGEKPPPPAPRPQLVLVVPWAPAFGKPGHRPPAVAPPEAGYRGFGRFINDGWVDQRRPSGSR